MWSASSEIVILTFSNSDAVRSHDSASSSAILLTTPGNTASFIRWVIFCTSCCWCGSPEDDPLGCYGQYSPTASRCRNDRLPFRAGFNHALDTTGQLLEDMHVWFAETEIHVVVV